VCVCVWGGGVGVVKGTHRCFFLVWWVGGGGGGGGSYGDAFGILVSVAFLRIELK